MTNHSPLPPPPPIPVICDRCRAEGVAGDPLFAELAGLLEFEPVPRRAHVSNWTPEHQRAYVAALAVTGSRKRAARAIGKYEFGADQLCKHPRGRSFAAACEAALELYRERERLHLQAGLADLAREQERLERPRPFDLDGAGPDGDDDEAESDELGPGSREVREARRRIRDRLLRARRLFLLAINRDPAKRAAWEELCGPVDWDRASRCEPQDNEPWPMPAMRGPDMLIPAEHGWLAEATGGPDSMEELRRGVAEIEAREAAGLPPFPEDEEGEGREGDEGGGA